MARTYKVTDLGYALLGLLKMKPASGYELRKTFATTPMAHYSSSPGAIYPALERLHETGLLRVTPDKSGSKRPKQTYHVTAKGWRTLQQWLRQPVTRDELVWRNQMVLLRFSFLDLLDDREVSIKFLKDFEKQVESQIDDVRRFLSTIGDAMPLHGRLAVEQGLANLQASLRWSSDALSQISIAHKKKRNQE